MPRALPILLFAALATGQDEPRPTAPPTPDELLARFDRLGKEPAGTVVRTMGRHLQRLDDDVLQGVMSLERGMRSYPMRDRRTWLSEQKYAPVAKKRHMIAAGTKAHGAATARMRPIEFLPDLHAAVVFDWGIGKAVRTGNALGDRERFANFVHGYPPGADHAVARLLEKFDTDARQRKLAWYFDHLYADRDGGVYEGVSLFAAWHASVLVEMPDTDAIAYAREVLATESFVSPMPPDRRRERLYRRIHEGFDEHRAYRSLLLAAAASFIAAEPRIEGTYRPLVKRCHWLWVQTGGDVEAFAAQLGKAESRSRFVQEIDQSIRNSPEVVTGRLGRLNEVATYVRALAAHTLTSVGG